jgi:hypothetical protein
MSRATGAVERRNLTRFSALALCALFCLCCGEGMQDVADDSLAPDKTVQAITGDNGSCTPILCPASSPGCPDDLHCFNGACVDEKCRPACQYGGTSGGVADAGDDAGASADVADAGDETGAPSAKAEGADAGTDPQ